MLLCSSFILPPPAPDEQENPSRPRGKSPKVLCVHIAAADTVFKNSSRQLCRREHGAPFYPAVALVYSRGRWGGRLHVLATMQGPACFKLEPRARGSAVCTSGERGERWKIEEPLTFCAHRDINTLRGGAPPGFARSSFGNALRAVGQTNKQTGHSGELPIVRPIRSFDHFLFIGFCIGEVDCPLVVGSGDGRS